MYNFNIMKTILRWEKGLFSSTCRIYKGEEILGELKDHAFKQTSEGRIRNETYRFKTRGFFSQETLIIDGKNDQVVGNISYRSWKTRATIQLEDRVFSWKYDNGWQTRWSIFYDNHIYMKFAGKLSRGTIEFEEENDLLVLTGLFVTNYYQQATIAILVAVFIPIWFSVLT
jgi:hypothetical protein